MFSSLRVRNFRIYWVGMLISLVGSSIQTVAQSWLVFHLTDSVFLLGMVGFLGTVPVFFLSLLGGVIADRINKRSILLFTQNAFMLLAFILAILTQLNLITPVQIMVISLLNGVVMAFDAPARQAVVVELAGKEHLFNAIALNSAAFNSARFIGPALAGILIAGIGMSGCFYINGISFIAVIIGLSLIKKNDLARRNNNKAVLIKDLIEGLRYIKDNKSILVLIIMVAITSLFGISYMILMPVFADNVLKVGIKGLGRLMSSTGLGALLAALILTRLSNFKYKGKLMVSSLIVFSIALTLFSASKAYSFSLFMLLIVGLSSVIGIGLINNSLQTLVPDEFRGRVMGVFMLTFAGIMPFGSLIAGFFSQFWGVSLTVMLSGIICVLFFIAIDILFPDIRKI